jgi:hypothetical protein
MWEEVVDALNAVNGGAHPGLRAVHSKALHTFWWTLTATRTGAATAGSPRIFV